MFVRILFLLLLALNIGAACWLYSTPRDVGTTLPPTDAGVPSLVLLNEIEHEGAAGNAEVTSPAQTRTGLQSDSCASIGPFTTQADMHAAVNALTPLVARIQFRDSYVTEARGYWVYLPAPANRERALAIARELSNKGLSDYYIVTVGDQPNTISLGLFRDPANAEKRRSEILALGFKPEVTQRSDEVLVYWIDYAQNSSEPLDWRAHLAKHADLQQQPINCF
jgi:hypothetical protein